jgi:tRNA 2-selenouridine synthase SelU
LCVLNIDVSELSLKSNEKAQKILAASPDIGKSALGHRHRDNGGSKRLATTYKTAQRLNLEYDNIISLECCEFPKTFVVNGYKLSNGGTNWH